jgi:galactokinase
MPTAEAELDPSPPSPARRDDRDRPALHARFVAQFGGEPQLYRAPGRVNLIGEHTDYNDGFVLPAALELSTWVAARKRPDRRLRVKSLLGGEALVFDLDDPAPKPRQDWSDYARGVAVALAGAGHALVGADLLIDSDVPIGSGLSSSAALEVSVGYALLDVAAIAVDRVKLARACQGAENAFVGMHCGIMDQFVSCCGAAGHALLLDCRSLAYRLVPIDPAARLVVCDSTVHHKLAAGQYNLRRESCERGVALLRPFLPGIRALRDVTLPQLAAHEVALDEVTLRRCRHVIGEDDRVVRGVAALEAGDLAGFGRLMNESHRSLRDDYEVSCPELDVLATLAWSIEGVFGARMIGGGFGGCTLNLVRADAVARFTAAIAEGYEKATKLTPLIFVCSPGDGVSAIAHRDRAS